MSALGPGQFSIGFFHPQIDSLGLAPPLRAVRVERGATTEIRLAAPSARTIRNTICGRSADTSAAWITVGFVRDARNIEGVAGAEVSASWNGSARPTWPPTVDMSTARAISFANGWYAICGSESVGAVTLIAQKGLDLTDTLQLRLGDRVLVRRVLFLGRANDSHASRGGGPDPSEIPSHVRGRVVGEGGLPLPGAIVAFRGGPRVIADSGGAWTLRVYVSGTRTLEARAIGYYPAFVPVDVIRGAAPMEVALQPLKTVLDTVRVVARFSSDADNGFEQRRRSLTGRFITRSDIDRRVAFASSELLRQVPGVRTEGGIRMRGPFGDCSPSLFIDGRLVPSPGGALSTLDLDMFVQPEHIAGIEIYQTVVPPQFQLALEPCGSIVVWTR
jgi:hypothetical protein